jgi:MFS family permease
VPALRLVDLGLEALHLLLDLGLSQPVLVEGEEVRLVLLLVDRGLPLQHDAHEGHVLRLHLRERMLVDAAAVRFRHDLLELFEECRLALALLLDRLFDLPAALAARDRLPIHGRTIIGAVQSRSPRVVLAAASAAQAAVSFVNFGLPAIGPEVRQEFGLSLPELGAVLTAGFFGSGLSLVAAGIAVDRLGSRAAMAAGTLLSVGALVAAGLADTAPALGGALVVFGIGSSVVTIAGAGALFRAYPPERRAWALGVRQMAVPLGGTIGAVLVPALEAVGGVSAALLAAAVGVCLAGAAFAVAADSVRGGRQARGFRTIMRAPGMQRLLVVAAFYILVLQAVLVYAVPAARAAGLSALAAGATFVVIQVAAGVARIVWGRVADRDYGARRVRTLAEAGLVAALGALLFTVALHEGAAVALPAAVVFGFGALGWNALVYVSAGERAPPELAGRSVAVAATVVFGISALATPPLGALAQHAGWDAFWLSTAALALAGSAVAATLPKLG